MNGWDCHHHNPTHKKACECWTGVTKIIVDVLGNFRTIRVIVCAMLQFIYIYKKGCDGGIKTSVLQQPSRLEETQRQMIM